LPDRLRRWWRCAALLSVAVCAIGVCGIRTPAGAQVVRSIHPHAPPLATAARRTGPIVIDGRLDDPAWAAAAPITTFTQVQPADGAPATQRTEVRFLYDADAIYIGARM